MRIGFKGKTNKNYVMINNLKLKLQSGSILTIDRRETEWTYKEKTGDLDMVWNDCYLYAIDDCVIFSDESNEGIFIYDEYAIKEFVNLIENSKAEFEIEDDADEDYWVRIETMSIR